MSHLLGENRAWKITYRPQKEYMKNDYYPSKKLLRASNVKVTLWQTKLKRKNVKVNKFKNKSLKSKREWMIKIQKYKETLGKLVN